MSTFLLFAPLLLIFGLGIFVGVLLMLLVLINYRIEIREDRTARALPLKRHKLGTR